MPRKMTAVLGPNIRTLSTFRNPKQELFPVPGSSITVSYAGICDSGSVKALL